MSVYGSVYGGSLLTLPTVSAVDNEDGTQTVTISGSYSLSTNTVYTRRHNTSTDEEWESQGSITGDGAVSLSLDPGAYFLYADSVDGLQSLTSSVVLFFIQATDVNARFHKKRDAAFQRRGQPITYNAIVSKTVNPRSGEVVESFNTTTISQALVAAVTEEDVAGSHGRVHIGDTLFRLRRSDSPESPPDQRSQIVFDGETFEIVWHRKSRDLYVWDVFGRSL